MRVAYSVTWRPTTILAVWLFGAALLAGCASGGPRIQAAEAPGIDLGAFRTFSFFANPSTDRAGFHTLVTQQLKFSVQREMEVRGFQFVADPTEAELLINFHTQVSEQVRVRSTPDPWVNRSYWNHRRGFYNPWPGHRSWPTHSRVAVDQFSEGQLNVDVVNASTQMLVWEGVASQRLTQRTMNELEPALEDAVHAMFVEFPVAPSL